MGSIPVRVTKENRTPFGVLFSFPLVPRTWESNTAHIPTTTIHFTKQVFMQRFAHHSTLVRYGDESLPHRLPWRPCRMGQIPVRVLFFFPLVTRTRNLTRRRSRWVRNIASSLSCRKPRKTRRLPVQKPRRLDAREVFPIPPELGWCFFALVTCTRNLTRRQSRWVRKIASSLSCRKPRKTRRLPVRVTPPQPCPVLC